MKLLIVLILVGSVLGKDLRLVNHVRASEMSSDDEADTDDSSVTAVTTKTVDIQTLTTLKPRARKPTIPGSTLSQVQILNQVDKIVKNVEGGHIYGIIDESLGIRNTSVQNLVRGILRTVFCGSLENFLNLCQQQQGQVSNTSSVQNSNRKISTQAPILDSRPVASYINQPPQKRLS